MHVFYDFKGFKVAGINLFAPLTVLIGPNGSGKSNVIEGVELLAFLVHGSPLHEVSDVGRTRSKTLEVRGGLQSCARYGTSYFGLGFLANIEFMGNSRPFSYRISVEVKPKPRIMSEELVFTDDETMIFKSIQTPRSRVSSDIQVEYNNFARGGHKPRVSVSGEISIISQYCEFARKNKRFKACENIVNGIMNWLQHSFVFDPNPKLMRVYERIGNDILFRDGANLSAVLYGLRNGTEKQRKSLERIIGWIRNLPEEPYGGLDFVTTSLNDVVFGLKENNSHLVDARLLSDGTLRCLAVLTALETVADRSRVVIEEFDNGLHPSRVRVLLEAIASCCKRKGINVLVTTHNPATLNALSEEQLSGVVFCVWNSEDKAFRLVNLSDLPRHDELLERGRLGDLVTRRIIEQYLAPKFEARHKKKAVEWVRALEL